MVELMVVMAIVSAIAVTSLPWMITYWQAATLKAGAEEMAAAFNRARQLAISRSQTVCVEVAGNRYRYWLNSCGGGTAWLGPESDVTGLARLANNVGITSNANPAFDYLGAANPGATVTVTNPRGGATLRVVVSVAGRVRICPAAGCAP